MISSVIVGAGKGKRFKSTLPKNFFNLKGKKIIEYSLETFNAIDKINEIILVLPAEYVNCRETKKWKLLFSKLKHIVAGGKVREESVYNGLICCSPRNNIVLIHDGARPFVNKKLIERVINGTRKYGACIPVYEVFGSIKTVRNHFLAKTIENNKFFVAQTPQGFNRNILISLMNKQKDKLGQFPDESSIFQYFGYNVRIVNGDASNIKITRKEDLRIAEKL